MNINSSNRIDFHLKVTLLGIMVLVASCTPVTPTPVSRPSVVPIYTSSLEKLGTTQVSPNDNATMVYVPAGQFPMGSEIGLIDEQPVHTVYLDAFWLDRTEVTTDMYRKCVEAGGCEEPYYLTYFNDPQFANDPVV